MVARSKKWAEPNGRMRRACDQIFRILEDAPTRAASDVVADALGIQADNLGLRTRVWEALNAAHGDAQMRRRPSHSELRDQIERVGAAAAALSRTIDDLSAEARALIAFNCNPSAMDSAGYPVLPDTDVADLVRDGSKRAIPSILADARTLRIQLRPRGRPPEDRRAALIMVIALLFEATTGKRASLAKEFREIVARALAVLEPQLTDCPVKSIRRALVLAAEMRPQLNLISPPDVTP